MGAGKKKKNEAFAVAPAISVDTLVSSNPTCGCGGVASMMVPFTAGGNTVIGSFLCPTCAHNKVAVNGFVSVNANGDVVPPAVFAEMGPDELSSLQQMSWVAYSAAVTSAKSDLGIQDISTVQKNVSTAAASAALHKLGAANPFTPPNITKGAGNTYGDFPVTALATASFKLHDDTEIVVFTSGAGKWEWVHGDPVTGGKLDESITYFTDPEGALGNFLSGTPNYGLAPYVNLAGTTVVRDEISSYSLENNTFELADGTQGKFSIKQASNGLYMVTAKISDSSVGYAESLDCNTAVTVLASKLMNGGVGRCTACGQFMSVKDASGHQCPPKKPPTPKKVPKKTAPVTTAKPVEDSAPAVSDEWFVAQQALLNTQTVEEPAAINYDSDDWHEKYFICDDCEEERELEDAYPADSGVYCEACYYDNGHEYDYGYDPDDDAGEPESSTTAHSPVPGTHPAPSSSPAYTETAVEEPVNENAIEQVAGSQLEGQAAVQFQQEHAHEAVTPIPQAGELTVGDGIGKHLILGGGDFYDSAVTVIAYADTKKAGSQRQVLFAEVTPEAEQKILDSLSGDGKMVEKTVTYTDTGRIPLDTENAVYDDILAASKSVNFHLKEQDEIPEHTLQRIASLEQRLKDIESDTSADPNATAMAAHYKTAVDNLVAWRDDWENKKAEFAASNGANGKLPKASEFTAEFTATKKEMVPAPGSKGLPTSVQKASTLSAVLNPDGTSAWDGSMKGYLGSGSQYKIDLGDGYVAYYRPHNGDHLQWGTPQTGARGQLDIVGPAGSDNPQKLIGKLRSLNLGHQPLTQAETEWSYLNANIFAQGMSSNMKIKEARQSSEIMIEAKAAQLTAARVHELVGLPAEEVEAWSKGIRLQAEKDSLAARTALLRDAVAVASGHTSGDALLASGNYRPAPVLSRAGVKWRRFDVSDAEIDKAWKSKKRGLHHAFQGDAERILDILRTGTFASQTRRRRLGVPKTGMSEEEDINTGGSRQVFLRNYSPAQAANYKGFYWSNPSVLLGRTDWYANESDGYGKMTTARHPLKVVGFTDHSNEVMFSDGIDIYGPEAPSYIKVPGSIRQQALDIVKARGITEVNGVPIDNWIL